ncbi:hypothetical protein [uncultured Sulfitobacter sp.]|uniref:hypothetical protein n=1 Tax=uncultured Sulfitobacter sp. TaxID=191468 RepID=UPI002623215F|nr:hypothetical protein [uncultured Sulfitobacter sp.]
MLAGMVRTILILILMPLPIFADIVTPQGRTIDCYCTDSTGDRVELGETICLDVNGRMFMAQCQMSLNVPMWRETHEGCLSSSLSPLGADRFDQPVQPRGIYPHI